MHNILRLDNVDDLQSKYHDKRSLEWKCVSNTPKKIWLDLLFCPSLF